MDTKKPPSGMSMLMKSFGLDPEQLQKMGESIADGAARIVRIEEKLIAIERNQMRLFEILGSIDSKLDCVWSKEHGRVDAGRASSNGSSDSDGRGTIIAS